MKKKIAIIGSGISGLSAGFLLHKLHDITLFEVQLHEINRQRLLTHIGAEVRQHRMHPSAGEAE